MVSNAIRFFELFKRSWVIGLLAFTGMISAAQDPGGPLQGAFLVDADSGAAILDFPLGPGIGEGELRYDPHLVGAFGPLVGLAPRAASQGGAEPAPVLLATSAFRLSPGTLDWCFTVEGCVPSSAGMAEWSYPDGREGVLGGPCPEGVEPEGLRARFGYPAAVGPDGLPHPAGSAPAEDILAGKGGELVLGLADGARFTRQAVSGVDATGKPVQWLIPAGILVIRGDCAYEYSYSECGRGQPGLTPDFAHYRLTAIRNAAGEALTFAYGGNGVDFEATWKSLAVRVRLDGVAPIPPLPALDDPISSLDPKLAFRDVVARLRIEYVGLPAPLAYALTAVARPEFRTPEGAFAGGFQGPWWGETGLRDCFRHHLQVNSIRKEGSREHVWFRYGKAKDLASPANGTAFAPVVLQEIGQPGRSIRLDWEGVNWTGASPSIAPNEAGSIPGGPWRYGVSHVEERVRSVPGDGCLRGGNGLIGGLKGGCPGSGDGASSSSSSSDKVWAGPTRYDPVTKEATIEVAIGRNPPATGSGRGPGAFHDLGGVEEFRGPDPSGFGFTRYIGTNPGGTFLVPVQGGKPNAFVQAMLERMGRSNAQVHENFVKGQQLVKENEARLQAQLAAQQQLASNQIQQVMAAQDAQNKAITARQIQQMNQRGLVSLQAFQRDQAALQSYYARQGGAPQGGQSPQGGDDSCVEQALPYGLRASIDLFGNVYAEDGDLTRARRLAQTEHEKEVAAAWHMIAELGRDVNLAEILAQYDIPLGGGLKAIGKTIAAIATANKAHHIFGKAGHELMHVVKQMGSKDAALKSLQAATEAAVKAQGLTGVFKIVVKIGDSDVTVRGKVVDGVVKIGTAFIP